MNVDRAELVQCRERYIARAVAPLNSVLDDSLGCVLWFASRAEGTEYILADQGSGQQPPPLPPYVQELFMPSPCSLHVALDD